MPVPLRDEGRTFIGHGVVGEVAGWGIPGIGEVDPACGPHFLAIGDHTAVDTEGNRRPSARLADQPTVDARSIVYDDEEGHRNFGEDASCIDLFVTIRPGEQLCFRWKFIAMQQGMYNDFAVFAAFPGNTAPPPRPYPADPADLGDPPPLIEGARFVELPLAEKRDRLTNTTEDRIWGPRPPLSDPYCWRPSGGFSGTVRWLSVNAQRVLIGREPRGVTRPTRLAHPPTLLVDCLAIG